MSNGVINLLVKTFFALSVILLDGCAAPGTTPLDVSLNNVKDVAGIPENTCYIAVKINFRDLGYNSRSGGKALLYIRSPGVIQVYNVGILRLHSGADFRVVAFRPGSYSIPEIGLGRYYGLIKRQLKFDCVDKQVVYIGDVDIDVDWDTMKYSIEINDRLEGAERSFAADFPNLSRSQKLVRGLAYKD